mgnify:CR=1 FL=1|tara:strand:+ start:250 stop:630 length:381 start_codon:yes stop_codon:yes gene_type:complete
MSEEFKFEIISPDERIYSGDTEEVVLPCFEGQITVLKNHIPLITFLRPGIIQIGKGEKFYAEDGTVEFSDNNLLILSTTIKNIKTINTDQKNIMIDKAERELSSNQISDKQKYILNYKIETLKQIN